MHAGARLGSDGFGYVFRGGAHDKIPHVGRCIIEDDVEIGANTTIDRGSIDDTVIGAGTKIDNLVQIAHNVRIGRLCLIMAQVGIAGSARVEDGCIIAGQVGRRAGITRSATARTSRGRRACSATFRRARHGRAIPARPHRKRFARRRRCSSFRADASNRASCSSAARSAKIDDAAHDRARGLAGRRRAAPRRALSADVPAGAERRRASCFVAPICRVRR